MLQNWKTVKGKNGVTELRGNWISQTLKLLSKSLLNSSKSSVGLYSPTSAVPFIVFPLKRPVSNNTIPVEICDFSNLAEERDNNSFLKESKMVS